jgi:nitrogen fixation protein FixH
MKKILSVLTWIMILMGTGYAYSFNSVYDADPIKVRTSSESNILAVGENVVTIELSDTAGKSITDSEVDIFYYMPSMPAMNYKVRTTLVGGKYNAVIKPVMPGEWRADINVKKAGNIIRKVSVDFDVK